MGTEVALTPRISRDPIRRLTLPDSSNDLNVQGSSSLEIPPSFGFGQYNTPLEDGPTQEMLVIAI